MIKFKNINNFIHKSWNFGLLIPLSNVLLMHLGRIIPKYFLNRISLWRNEYIESKLVKMLNIAIDNDYRHLHDSFDENKEKLIWFFWYQGMDNMPEIPNLCYRNVIRYCNDCRINFISKDNYQEYITIPEKIELLKEKGRISVAHFSDIIRFNLLYKYGGCWIDSTVLLTDKLDKQVFSLPFYSIKNQKEGYYVSECRWAGFFLSSHRGNPFMKYMCLMFEQYWSKNKYAIDYFLFDYFIDILYKKCVSVKNMIDQVPFNNENVHKLAPVLYSQLDRTYLNQLLSSTSMFKLSWKTYKTGEYNNTYFEYLKNNN